MPTAAKAKAKLKYVSPDKLDFDPSNPRFGGLMDDCSQDDIQRALLGQPYYASELIDSLVENGFIDYEPLVVRTNGDRYSVVEGNRRLAAIREIRTHFDRYAGRKSDLDSIPVLEFPEKPDEQQQNEMRVYLGVRHLLGFRDWPPVSKAQFLEREIAATGSIERAIKELRITKTQVRRFLVPYRLLQSVGVSVPEGQDFWVLGEALSRNGVKKFLQLEVDSRTLQVTSYDKKNLAFLLDCLYGPKKDGRRDPGRKVVRDTRDLSRLANVLGSEKATATLRGGKPLGEAEIYVDTREQSMERLSEATRELGVLLGKLIAGARDVKSTDLLRSYKQLQAAVKAFVAK